MCRLRHFLFFIGLLFSASTWAASPTVWICQPVDTSLLANASFWTSRLKTELPESLGGIRVENTDAEPDVPLSALRFDFVNSDSTTSRTLQALAAIIEGVNTFVGRVQLPDLHLVVKFADVFSTLQVPQNSSSLLICHVTPTGYRVAFAPDQPLSGANLQTLLPVRPGLTELCTTQSTLPLFTLRPLAALIAARHLGLTTDAVKIELGGVLQKFDSTTLAAVFAIAIEQHRLCKNQAEGCDLQAARQAYSRAQSLSRDFPHALGWILLNKGACELFYGEADSAVAHLGAAKQLFIEKPDSIGLALGALLYSQIWQDRRNLTQANLSLSEAYRWLPTSHHFVLRSIIESFLKRLNAGADSSVNPVADGMGNQAGTKPATVSDTAAVGKVAAVTLSPYEEAERIYQLAAASLRAHDLPQAVSYMQIYLQQATELRSEPAISRGYFQLGSLFYQMNRNEEAIKNYRYAADYLEMLNDTCGLAKIDNNLGAVYHKIGERAKAEGHYRSALQLAEKCRDIETQIRSTVNLGDLHAEERRWVDAQADYSRALALAQSTADPAWLSTISYAKGSAHIQEGLLDLAYMEIRQALEYSNGSVQNAPAEEQAFLRKLENMLNRDSH